jgi:hypothetical protein
LPSCPECASDSGHQDRDEQDQQYFEETAHAGRML